MGRVSANVLEAVDQERCKRRPFLHGLGVIQLKAELDSSWMYLVRGPYWSSDVCIQCIKNGITDRSQSHNYFMLAESEELYSGRCRKSGSKLDRVYWARFAQFERTRHE